MVPHPSFVRRLKHPLLLLLVVLSSYGLLLLLRIQNIEFRYGGFTDCRGCFVKPILIHEARLAAFWLILLALSMYLRGAVATLLRWLVVLALLLQLADVVLMSTLSTRLYLAGLDKIPVSWPAIFSFAHAWSSGDLRELGLLLLVVATLFVAGYLVSRTPASPRVVGGVLALGIFCGLGGFLVPDQSAYMLAATRENFVELNLPKGQYLPYSPAFRQQIEASRRQAAPCTCLPGRDSKKDIILLVVESLSNYQSEFFAGPLKLTPNLDRIAAANKSFTRFHANSFHTINGLVALLNGRPTMPSADEKSTRLEVSLPNYLKRFGYRTHYLTPAKFSRLKNDEATVRALGFEEIEGRTSYYDGADELQFGAAPDDVFYRRILDALEATAKTPELRARPHFWTLVTGGTHQPFNRKNENNSSLANAFRFADQELGHFYDELVKRDFFANGILLITGDHHSMTPLRAEEYTRFGLAASSLVPLVIVDGETAKPEIIDRSFQQADLFQSIQFLVEKDVCRDPARGNLFGGHLDGPDCIFHERGDERDQVNFFCREGQGTIQLKGDQSAFIGTEPPLASTILDRLHFERLQTHWRNFAPEESATRCQGSLQ